MLERGNTLFVGAAPPRGTIPGKNCTSFGPQLWRILAAMRFREDHRSGWYDRSYHPDSGGSMGHFLLRPKAAYDTRRFSHDRSMNQCVWHPCVLLPGQRNHDLDLGVNLETGKLQLETLTWILV